MRFYIHLLKFFFFSIYSLVSFLEKLYNLWTSLFELLLSTSWLMELLRRGLLLSFLASFCLNIVMTDLDYLFWNKFVDFYSYFCVHLDKNYAEPDYLRFRPQRSVRRRWLWMWLSGVMLALHSWGNYPLSPNMNIIKFPWFTVDSSGTVYTPAISRFF